MIVPFLSIKEIKESYLKKIFTKQEYLSFCIDQFKKHDSKIGSVLEVFESDSIISKSNNSGILDGIPGIAKDNICQKDRIVSCSSKMLENYKAVYDATVISNLFSEGAFVLGRANCDEFAMGSSNEYSAFKKAYNPWDISRVPGGSSGGSVAAVAAGFVPWSLGSDTGGSIRLPAAFCGVVGMKPTYGLVSRYGLVAYGSSLDQIGPVTRTVYDNALVLSCLAGNDEKDSTSLKTPKIDYTKNLNEKMPSVTIGIVENAVFNEGIDKEVSELLESAIKDLESLGVKFKRVKLDSMQYSAACYFMISRAEAASNLAKFDGVRYGYRSKNSDDLKSMYCNTRNEGFGFEVKSRILVGNYVLSAGHADAYYNSANKVRALMRAEFLEALKNVDLLMIPASSCVAFQFDKFDKNSIQMDLLDYFTAPANLTGLPAISVPCGFTKNSLPAGFQLLGKDLSEELIFQVAYAYEQLNKFYKQTPRL